MFTSKIRKICFILLLPIIIWASFYLPVFFRLPNIPLYENISSYIHPEKNTSLILPESQCNGTVIIVVVCSAVQNFKARNNIRKTWMKYTSIMRSIQVYFLLGKPLIEANNIAVRLESDKYADIIQENFVDSYNNLTLKSVMLLKWVKRNCDNAKYVMKTDDDVFVHLPNLFNLLEASKSDNLLLGFRINDGIPERDRSSKYFIPDYMFPDPTYPPYLSGTGYVMSVNIVSDLFQAAQKTKFHFLEDVFITGMCAIKIGIRPTHQDSFLFTPGSKLPNCCCVFNTFITVHKLLPEEMLNIWQKCYQTISLYELGPSICLFPLCPSCTHSFVILSIFSNSKAMLLTLFILSVYQSRLYVL